SSVTTATPFSRTATERIAMLAALQDHREAHPALGADRDQPELDVAADHLVRQGGDDPGAGRAEGMADRDRAAVDVGPLPVDLPDRLGPAQLFGPGLRAPGFDVGEHLRGERLVDLHQPAVAEPDPGP